MLNNFSLIRNIGKFDSVDSGAHLNLNRLALIYAENGRGKTTLATILRSLSSKVPLPIIERTRLGGQGTPHVVIGDNNGNTSIFQNGEWNDHDVNILVFDDHFVSDNIYSGIEVDTEHRQKLHELIIGAEGVTLNVALQEIVERIETHNQSLRIKAVFITESMRHGLNVEDFCALENIDDIDNIIHEAERSLSAAKKSETIEQKSKFIPISIPDFNSDSLNLLLEKSLPDIEATAAEQVNTHISSLNEHITSLNEVGETWVSDGMKIVSENHLNDCPFCKQKLSGSEIIAHYQSIFSQEYRTLKEEITSCLSSLNTEHRPELMTAFERNVRKLSEDRQFWSEFIDIPEINLDTALITRLWGSSFKAINTLLEIKKESPLEVLSINEVTVGIINEYREARIAVHHLSNSLVEVNERIDVLKESALGSNVASLGADLNHLKAVKSRYTDAVATLCNDYLAEVGLKTATQQERVMARAALDEYREQVFPLYQEAINRYLRIFNTGFLLDNVSSVNNRGGSSCNYSVLIENIPVPLRSNGEGLPSFKTTLSSGDRNALALAFFFSSIEMSANSENMIVVIDDPMTSLDDHRTLTTIQQIKELINTVEQVIVLSHSKPFLCNLWSGAQSLPLSTMKISRSGSGSILSEWDVNQDSITEHDRNFLMVIGFIDNGHGADERSIAVALRPMLESYIRVTCPNIFPPGSLLGPFIRSCQQRENTPNQILSPDNRTELRALLDYANQFHHDTNTACKSANINEQELLDHARRTINFLSI